MNLKLFLFAFLITTIHFQTIGQAVKITVSQDQVLERSYLGNGVQWSGYPEKDISEEDWKKTFDRLDFMKLNFVRLIVNANEYCKTFPLGGKPEYQFESELMKRVYRILDYCQSRNVQVIFGEWSDPAYKTREYDFSKGELRHDGIQEYDPRWTYIITDLLTYLVKEKKYTCIKYYNLGNEPNGDWMHTESFATWRLSILNLDQALKSKGLRDQIKIVGPDCAWGNHWIKMIIEDKELVKAMDAYEVHSYGGKDEIEKAQFEKEMTYFRNYITEKDPNGKNKPFFMGEVGMVHGKNDKDQQTYIATHQYGVWMADYIIQGMRAGQAGLIAWDLDDAMHASGRRPGNTVMDYDWKEWGFWDSFGAEKGKPERENARPWYYSWSLLSKYVPKGAEVLKTTESDTTRTVRSTAAKFQSGGKQEYTFAVINQGDAAKQINLSVPGVGKLNLVQFNYFENDSPKDKQGYPIPAKNLKNANLQDGISISMPARSVIILTTMTEK